MQENLKVLNVNRERSFEMLRVELLLQVFSMMKAILLISSSIVVIHP